MKPWSRWDENSTSITLVAGLEAALPHHFWSMQWHQALRVYHTTYRGESMGRDVSSRELNHTDNRPCRKVLP